MREIDIALQMEFMIQTLGWGGRGYWRKQMVTGKRLYLKANASKRGPFNQRIGDPIHKICLVNSDISAD